MPTEIVYRTEMPEESADFDSVKRLGEAIGAAKATHMISSIVDAAKSSLYKQIKDSGMYKITGKTWKEFCEQELKRSDRTIDTEIKYLEELGEPFLTVAERIGLRKRDLSLISYKLSPESRAELRAGKIKIGEMEFEVDELADRADEFKSAIDILNKNLELSKKAEKLANSKLDGIDKEHQKEIKALTQQVKQFEAQVVSPTTPEEFDRLFKLVEDKVSEIVILCMRLNFAECHSQLSNEGLVKAKYNGRINVAENQFAGAVEAMRDAVLTRG